MNNQDIKSDKINECVEYFGQSSIWKRIFKGFRSKYASYGHFSGSVAVKNLTSDDIAELEGFFGQNYHGQKSVTISAARFEKALKNSRFQDISPEDILNKYFNEPLLGKSTIKDIRSQKIAQIENEYMTMYQNTPAGGILKEIQGIVKQSRDASQNDNKDRMLQALEEWKSRIWLCAKLYNNLPYRNNNRVYLAVFAAGITGNPHAFDHGTADGKLLYKMIQTDLTQRGIIVEATELFPAYKKQKSFLLAGIMIDDISNYAMLYNVQALKMNGDYHKGVQGFFIEKDIIQLPLNVISELGSIECIDNEIHIIENPSVFAMLCRDKSCMCMNGQPRLAGLMILELLAKTGTHVFYSGDLDPEGILIAQKLARFYHGRFDYYHMDEADYNQCRSAEKLSERRLRMLDKITDERLIPVAKKMAVHKMAGYQENGVKNI